MTRRLGGRTPPAWGVNLTAVVAILALTTGCITTGAQDPGADATRTGERVDPASSAATSASVNASEAPRVVERTAQISFTLGLGFPCTEQMGCGVGAGYIEHAEFALTDAGPAKATLTATWETAAPVSDYVLTVNHESNGEWRRLARESGPSPLVLELPEDALATGDLLEAYAFPSPGGVMTSEDVIEVLLRLEYP